MIPNFPYKRVCDSVCFGVTLSMCQKKQLLKICTEYVLFNHAMCIEE